MDLDHNYVHITRPDYLTCSDSSGTFRFRGERDGTEENDGAGNGKEKRRT